MSRTEYRVVHKTPGAMDPAPMPTKEYAESYIRIAGKYLSISDDLKIQSRTVTEWEDV